MPCCMFYKTKNFLLDLVFPLACILCNDPGTLICKSCEKTLRPNDARSQNQIYSCGPFSHELLERMITSLKYGGVFALAPIGATWMSRVLLHRARELIKLRPTVIPIPLHPRKKRIRGFNQSERLAAHLGTLLNLPCDTALRRARATPSQTKLTREQRQENVQNAFVYPRERAPQHVLLIDDVITTGATLNDAARALKEKGTETVSGCTLAYEK